MNARALAQDNSIIHGRMPDTGCVYWQISQPVRPPLHKSNAGEAGSTRPSGSSGLYSFESANDALPLRKSQYRDRLQLYYTKIMISLRY